MSEEPAASGLTFRIYAVLLLVIVLAVLLVWIFGLPMLGLLGIVLTLVVFALLIAFTAGN
ncbi:hypothetical protein [Paracoccus sp. (in: a-proteobacteria)]|uniref:hypothetical protein n=1 Tax=Paracoccus sp. TaxID=267 RepID=UPI003A8403DD